MKITLHNRSPSPLTLPAPFHVTLARQPVEVTIADNVWAHVQTLPHFTRLQAKGVLSMVPVVAPAAPAPAPEAKKPEKAAPAPAPEAKSKSAAKVKAKPVAPPPVPEVAAPLESNIAMSFAGEEPLAVKVLTESDVEEMAEQLVAAENAQDAPPDGEPAPLAPLEEKTSVTPSEDDEDASIPPFLRPKKKKKTVTKKKPTA